MPAYTTYRLSDGAITGLYEGPQGGISAPSGQALADGHHDPATTYLPAGVATPRQMLVLVPVPAEIAADGVEEATVAGIPAGCAVEALGPDGAVLFSGIHAGGNVVLASTAPGTLTLRGQRWPDIARFEVTVEAVDP